MSNETDADLVRRASAARGMAHRAPRAEWSKDHKGHHFIVRHTDAWASRGTDFLAVMAELDKRGLPMPPCDCPDGAHDEPEPR